MADTATVTPATDPSISDTPSGDLTEYTLPPAESDAPVPAADQRPERRGRPRAVPLLVHGSNATGITLGAAYLTVGVPGLAAAGAVGAAVGAAALARKAKRSKTSAARKAARTAAAGSSAAPASGTGRRGRSRTGAARGNSGRPRTGSGTRTGGRTGRSRHAGGAGTVPGGSVKGRRGSNGPKGPKKGPKSTGAGPGGSGTTTPNSGKGAAGSSAPKGSGAGGPKSGKAWQTLKKWAGKARRSGKPRTRPTGTTGGTGTGGGTSGTGPGGNGSASRSGRGSWLRAAARRLRHRSGASGTSPRTAAGSPRIYRWRRIVTRKLAHTARCAGAMGLAALGGLLTMPFGLLWGTWRLFTNHRDPLGGFALPVRVAGRIWRFFLRRSRARHDAEARADSLTLTVSDPGKDTTAVSGPSLTSGTSVLDGRTSTFARAMHNAAEGYIHYNPSSMMEVAAEFAGLPHALRATVEAIKDLGIRAEQGMPISPAVLYKLAEAVAALLVGVNRAEHLDAHFRTVHRFDIERIMNPRNGEHMWNVTPTGSRASATDLFRPGRIEAGCAVTKVAYQAFAPTHMMQVGSEVQGIGYGLADLAHAVQVLHERTRDRYPVEHSVTTALNLVVAAIKAAADHAELAGKTFLTAHAREISHNTNPRKGPASEGMWNAP